ncbi:MAG: hypothetical protein ACLFVU_12035 [Phycisphaerae bacterium]
MHTERARPANPGTARQRAEASFRTLPKLVYNLVRAVTVDAARRQGVAVGRISFVDALRWLRRWRPGRELIDLIVNPDRPGRLEPRVLKRRPKQYSRMTHPRDELRKALLNQQDAA